MNGVKSDQKQNSLRKVVLTTVAAGATFRPFSGIVSCCGVAFSIGIYKEKALFMKLVINRNNEWNRNNKLKAALLKVKIQRAVKVSKARHRRDPCKVVVKMTRTRRNLYKRSRRPNYEKI